MLIIKLTTLSIKLLSYQDVSDTCHWLILSQYKPISVLKTILNSNKNINIRKDIKENSLIDRKAHGAYLYFISTLRNHV